MQVGVFVLSDRKSACRSIPGSSAVGAFHWKKYPVYRGHLRPNSLLQRLHGCHSGRSVHFCRGELCECGYWFVREESRGGSTGFDRLDLRVRIQLTATIGDSCHDKRVLLGLLA